MKSVEKFKGWMKSCVFTGEYNLLVDGVLAERVNAEEVVVGDKIYKFEDLEEVELQNDKITFKCVFSSKGIEIKLIKMAYFGWGF